MINHLGKIAGASKTAEKKGLLLASGLITGEALMGILVAVPISFQGIKTGGRIFMVLNFLDLLLFLL